MVQLERFFRVDNLLRTGQQETMSGMESEQPQQFCLAHMVRCRVYRLN